jgi:hypothetical protein
MQGSPAFFNLIAFTEALIVLQHQPTSGSRLKIACSNFITTMNIPVKTTTAGIGGKGIKLGAY